MRVWRICRAPHAAETLAGRGGLHASGRWHTRGRPIVYTSQSLALAALEVLVHVERETAPSDLVRVEIDVPEGLRIREVANSELPTGWRSYPPPAALQALGDRWIEEGATAVLRVPSAVIPEESNLLLNPRHPESRRVRVASIEAFRFDDRLAT